MANVAVFVVSSSENARRGLPSLGLPPFAIPVGSDIANNYAWQSSKLDAQNSYKRSAIAREWLFTVNFENP